MTMVVAAIAAINCGGYLESRSVKGSRYSIETTGREFKSATFAWKVDGQVVHKGELPLKGHYDATAHPSPAGNGFIVTCPNQGNDLIAFYTPKGERVTGFGWEVFPEEDRETVTIGCCGTLLVSDTSFSDDGWWMTIRAGRSSVRVFVPAGRPMDAVLRAQLDALLSEPKVDVDGLVARLGDDDAEARLKAAWELKTGGVRHIEKLEAARKQAAGERKAQLDEILEALSPAAKLLLPLEKDPAFRKAAAR